MSPTLTQDQIDEYYDQGYVIVDDVFSQSELKDIDTELDRLMDQGAGEDAHGKSWIMRLGFARGSGCIAGTGSAGSSRRRPAICCTSIFLRRAAFWRAKRSRIWRTCIICRLPFTTFHTDLWWNNIRVQQLDD